MSKSEQTKAFIIEKTAPIFNTKGYAGTSLSDMTDATKLTKGSIYGNFANKDEVALAAFDHNLGKVRSVIIQEMAKHSSAVEKLLAYGKIYTNPGDFPFPAGGCPILNTAIESDDTHPELKKKVAAAIYSLKKALTDMLETGIKNKEFRKDVDTEQTAIAILALLEGGIMISRVIGKPSSRMAILKALEAFIAQLKY